MSPGILRSKPSNIARGTPRARAPSALSESGRQETGEGLPRANQSSSGADDRVFGLDRAKLDECRALVTDRKELAAMRHK
jgi:hypothetical protein